MFGACVATQYWSVDLVYPGIKQERNANFVPGLLKIVRKKLKQTHYKCDFIYFSGI